MGTTSLSDALLTKIKEQLKSQTVDLYWDYRDELSEEQIVKIIKGESNEVENEICEYNIDHISDLERDYIIETLNKFQDEILEETGEDEFDAEDLYDELIDYVTTNLNIEQLYKNSRSVHVRVETLSNYDCINSHWFEGGYFYKESYFGAMVDALNLNPAKVKKLLNQKGINTFGSYPNKKNRDGKEYVTYESFHQELINSSCGGNLLTFAGKVDLTDFIDTYEKKLHTITIPAGNRVGIFSSMQGGGSIFEMELLRPFTINLQKTGKTIYDTYKLFYDDDTDGGYGINEVYSVMDSFFGKELTVTFK